MKVKNQSSSGKFSTYLAITCFAIGTFLLLLQKCFPYNTDILVAGFIYVIIAVIINGVTLLYLLYHFIINRLERETIAIRILILLANIPIAFLYLTIVFPNLIF